LKAACKKDLKVTQGKVQETSAGFLMVSGPKERAQFKHGRQQHAVLRFRYRSPSEKVMPLASGGIVRQIGLKLRTKNTCNLLYVMWRICPDEYILVTLKRNPDKSMHKQCQASGYQAIATIPLGSLQISAKDHKMHTISACLDAHVQGYRLTVIADDRKIWSGTIDADVMRDMNGPAGFRSDNGNFIFKLYCCT
jgi:hypothetical protein